VGTEVRINDCIWWGDDDIIVICVLTRLLCLLYDVHSRNEHVEMKDIKAL